MLLDASRDAREQLADVALPDAVLLTHGHRDASGGIAVVDELAQRAGRRVRVLCAPATARVLRHRRGGGRLPHVMLDETPPGRVRRVARMGVLAVEVPHAHDVRFPTYAWLDHALPQVCGWDVGRIVLTQIGRTVPPRDEAVAIAGRLCERATLAFDSLTLSLCTGRPV